MARVTSTIVTNRRRFIRSASAPAGSETSNHGSRPATATAAIDNGLLVSVTAKSGNATWTRPSPSDDVPVAASNHQ